MICKQCHAENLEGAEKCAKCGAPLSAAPVPPTRVEDEFELQPEAHKAPERQTLQGPATIDLDKLGEEEDDKEKPDAAGKKPKKEIPERPKDYKRESQILMAVMGALMILPVAFCFGDYCGHGFPNVVGLIFGGLALLESMKVDEFHKAGDYEGAEKAAQDARNYIKIGVIAAIAALVIVVGIQIAMLVLQKMSNVVSPRTNIE